MEDLKVCTKCDTEKPIRDFAIDSRKSDGRSSWCKECYRSHNKALYLGSKSRKKQGSAHCTKCGKQIQKPLCKTCGSKKRVKKQRSIKPFTYVDPNEDREELYI